jgi:hypothetical protein
MKKSQNENTGAATVSATIAPTRSKSDDGALTILDRTRQEHDIVPGDAVRHPIEIIDADRIDNVYVVRDGELRQNGSDRFDVRPRGDRRAPIGIFYDPLSQRTIQISRPLEIGGVAVENEYALHRNRSLLRVYRVGEERYNQNGVQPDRAATNTSGSEYVHDGDFTIFRCPFYRGPQQAGRVSAMIA